MTATAAVRTAAATNPPHLRPRRKAGIRSEESGKTTYRPMDNFGFLKVAAAVPHVRVGDCDFNTERIAAMAEEAAQRGVEIVAFPELAVTAYTCADLLLQPALLDAADEALARLVKATRKLPLVIIAGAPLRHGSTLYNCAVVFTQGRVLGVVPKTYIPDYTEFYENRWFASGAGISEETISVA